MDKLESSVGNDQHVEDNIEPDNPDVCVEEERATQEGAQMENINHADSTAEPDGPGAGYTQDTGGRGARENAIEIPTHDEFKPLSGTFDENVFTDKIEKKTAVPLNKASPPVKRVKRRKKRSDIGNPADSEEDGDVERPRRRRKKKRKHRAPSAETTPVGNHEEVKTDCADTRPQVSPSNDAGYESFSSVKGSRQSRSNTFVINSQNHTVSAKNKTSDEQQTQAKRMDIFTVQCSQTADDTNVSQLRTGETEATEGERKKKKRKKKKLHGFKKTKGAVGVLPQPGDVRVSEHAQHDKGAEGDTVPDDDESVTGDKKAEPVHPEPLRLCKILAGYPISSFRKPFYPVQYS